MGGSTLRKLSHPVESSTTFNYFTWRVKCKNQFSKLIPTLHFETMCVNESREGICREGKIPDLSQADTLYYQVHKIQPITKHHVLLLGFVITTQKPIEICQVSCKNQSHLSTCKQWHKHLSACKRWHRQTNQAMTCVTNQTTWHSPTPKLL